MSVRLPVPDLRYVAIALLSAALVTGCGRSANADSVESLKSDPGRLKVVLEQCKQPTEAMSERKCRLAAEAWRQRFFADSHSNRSGETRAYEASRP